MASNIGRSVRARAEFAAEAKGMVDRFLDGRTRAIDFSIRPNLTRAYARRSVRAHYGPCLDLAVVLIMESRRRRGFFKTLLGVLEEAARGRNLCLYVECVNNPLLREILLRYGYRESKNATFDYVKEFSEQESDEQELNISAQTK